VSDLINTLIKVFALGFTCGLLESHPVGWKVRCHCRGLGPITVCIPPRLGVGTSPLSLSVMGPCQVKDLGYCLSNSLGFICRHDVWDWNLIEGDDDFAKEVSLLFGIGYIDIFPF
jgi:hypothetical protein